MNAAQIFKTARAAGVELALDGDHLVLKAALVPPATVLEALARHKVEIMALLRPGRDGWSGEDWQAFFDGALASQSSVAGCHVTRPRLAPSLVRSSNGSIVIPFIRRPAAALGVGRLNSPTIR